MNLEKLGSFEMVYYAKFLMSTTSISHISTIKFPFAQDKTRTVAAGLSRAKDKRLALRPMVLENKLNSSSQIYLRWWYLIYYRSCVATLTISQLADNSATPPPTERVLLLATKKTRDNLSIISRELREEDSNLRPPGYEPGKLTNCSTPRCISTLNGVPLFCWCKDRANFA